MKNICERTCIDSRVPRKNLSLSPEYKLQGIFFPVCLLIEHIARSPEENEFITMDGWFGQVGKVVALEFSTFLAEEIKMPMLLVLASVLNKNHSTPQHVSRA